MTLCGREREVEPVDLAGMGRLEPFGTQATGCDLDGDGITELLFYELVSGTSHPFLLALRRSQGQDGVQALSLGTADIDPWSWSCADPRERGVDDIFLLSAPPNSLYAVRNRSR